MQCIFVEMVLCREYPRMLTLFRAMCIVQFTSNRITDEFVRFISAETVQEFIDHVTSQEAEEDYDEDTSSLPLYEASPFFKDFSAVYEELKERYKPADCSIVEFFLKKYMAYVPLWTAICHTPKSGSVKPNYIPMFRFNTNCVERYWGQTKESLRAQILEYGKTPIAISRFIRFKKSQVCIKCCIRSIYIEFEHNKLTSIIVDYILLYKTIGTITLLSRTLLSVPCWKYSCAYIHSRSNIWRHFLKNKSF